MKYEYIIITAVFALLCCIAVIIIRKVSKCKNCPYRSQCNKEIHNVISKNRKNNKN